MRVRWCSCTGFVLWYDEDGFRVCQCGHTDADHLDGFRSCVGEVMGEG